MATTQQQHPFHMERVLFNLHHKFCTFALHQTSRRGRSCAEHSILVVAVCAFGALLLVHLTFVHRDRLIMGPRHKNIPVNCLASIPGFDRNVVVTHLLLLEEGDFSESHVVRRPEYPTLPNFTANTKPRDPTCPSKNDAICEPTHDNVRFSYSLEKAYLLLSPELCEIHDVEAQYVQVSRTDAQCFGEPFLQTLIFSWFQPDTVMTNWLLGTYKTRGFIYNPRTKVMTDLSQFQSLAFNSKEHDRSPFFDFKLIRRIKQLIMKTTIIFKTSFLFFITTTLVSFTLRETQARMLDFTHHLAEYVRTGRPVVHLVTTHVVENLVFVPIMVGMIFFLIEFYRGDKFLAFMVLSLVWVCESFSVVSLRTKQGIHFFPRIFYMLFSMFNFYNFSFPFGFSYSALATSICFMLHSMLFFWHRYELPAVILGRISPEHPRQANQISSGTADSVTPPQVQSTLSGSGRSTPENVDIANLVEQPTRHPALARSASFGTVASGRLSRSSSTGGMFHDGDDDGSYMFFMDGEVVMHRHDEPRMTSQFLPHSSLSESDGPPDVTNVFMEQRRNYHVRHHSLYHHQQHHRPDVASQSLETLLASGVSTDETENSHTGQHVRDNDDNATRDLQAILINSPGFESSIR